LVVFDVLAMGVAMARGPDLVTHLKSVKRGRGGGGGGGGGGVGRGGGGGGGLAGLHWYRKVDGAEDAFAAYRAAFF
ncbi:hypothetical protein ABMZ66_33700, partial [Pseudomonas aeruginosa]